MFDLYKLDSIVSNKELLKNFNFEIEDILDKKILKIEKIRSAKPILFYVNLDFNYTVLFNLLRQPYFPSSTTILSKIGKYVMDSASNPEIRQRSCIDGTLPWFNDIQVSKIIIRYFRYKNINFDSRGRIQKKDLDVVQNHGLAETHLLIKYFKTIVKKAIYEEEVFKAIVNLFDTLENTPTSLINILRCIKYVDDGLRYRSLFIQAEDGPQPTNYGRALSASHEGETILYGDLDWNTFIRRRESSESLMTEISLSSMYEPVLDNQLEKFTQSRQQVLTSAATSDYNRTIPDLIYWNINE